MTTTQLTEMTTDYVAQLFDITECRSVKTADTITRRLWKEVLGFMDSTESLFSGIGLCYAFCERVSLLYQGVENPEGNWEVPEFFRKYTDRMTPAADVLLGDVPKEVMSLEIWKDDPYAREDRQDIARTIHMVRANLVLFVARENETLWEQLVEQNPDNEVLIQEHQQVKRFANLQRQIWNAIYRRYWTK